MYSATYSPEDNKFRLSSMSRLDAETYARVRAAGFIWAPKQEIFVAPMWTPSREDLLIEMCGEIGDEDTTLVARAEERAERFEEYKENRAEDAEQARAAVERIADGIPFGQPILVGHHSERHARKDAERIENGMRKAVSMWKTSQYWEQRAKGALRHAKYKELPAVRYRRIKGIESDLRKELKHRHESHLNFKLWIACSKVEDKEKQLQLATHIASTARVTLARKEGDRPDFDQRPSAYDALTNSYPNLYAPRTLDEVLEAATAPSVYPASMVRAERWIAHYQNRIAYERAMLDEQGGLKGEQFDYKVGGTILRRGYWLPILKVNKRAGIVQSVTVSGHFASTVSVDEIREYKAPEGDAEERVKAATKLPPMCNYPGEGFRHMTTKEWKARHMSDVPQSMKHAATPERGRHRTRSTAAPQWSTVAVYLTDSKRIDPPAPKPEGEAPVKLERVREPEPPKSEKMENFECARSVQTTRTSFEEIEQALKHGVQVVSAPQLFPTPKDLALRMVEEAEIEGGHRVLEPSVGTGSIAKVVFDAAPVRIVAVELSARVLEVFKSSFQSWDNSRIEIHCADFLDCNGNLGTFDRVLMNPPFQNADDIKHIKHAVHMLKPGGRLVAICAGGPRQERELRPLAEGSGGTWEPLPAGTFESSGTNVNTVLLTINASATE